MYEDKHYTTIIAGTRGYGNQLELNDLIARCPWRIKKVLSGGCVGVDRMGELYARAHSLPVRRYEPDWDQYGVSAGPRRNAEMARDAEALILLWDGRSKGSANMLRTARRYGLAILSHEYNPDHLKYE